MEWEKGQGAWVLKSRWEATAFLSLQGQDDSHKLPQAQVSWAI